jgi:hypothetical protein
MERTPEILAQIDNQFAFVSAITGLHPERHRFTVELLVNAIQFTVLLEMQFKHLLAGWRPVQYSEQVQPMITTPGHGSFPSGHATQAFVLARLLAGILPASAAYDPMREQLYWQAARIATNRVVAGVHFPVDSVAGRLLGHSIAEYVLSLLAPATQVCVRTFTGQIIGGGALDGTAIDLDIDDAIDPGLSVPNTYSVAVVPIVPPQPPLLRELFRLGQAERAALAP